MIGHTGFVLDTRLGKTHKLFLDMQVQQPRKHMNAAAKLTMFTKF